MEITNDQFIEFLGKMVMPNSVRNLKLRNVIIRSTRLIKYESKWTGEYKEHDRYGDVYVEYSDHDKYSERPYSESVDDY
jgi:hypothetical protein